MTRARPVAAHGSAPRLGAALPPCRTACSNRGPAVCRCSSSLSHRGLRGLRRSTSRYSSSHPPSRSFVIASRSTREDHHVRPARSWTTRHSRDFRATRGSRRQLLRLDFLPLSGGRNWMEANHNPPVDLSGRSPGDRVRHLGDGRALRLEDARLTSRTRGEDALTRHRGSDTLPGSSPGLVDLADDLWRRAGARPLADVLVREVLEAYDRATLASPRRRLLGWTATTRHLVPSGHHSVRTTTPITLATTLTVSRTQDWRVCT